MPPFQEKKAAKHEPTKPNLSKFIRKLRKSGNSDDISFSSNPFYSSKSSRDGNFPVSIGGIRSMRLRKYAQITTSGFEKLEEDPSISQARSRELGTNIRSSSRSNSGTSINIRSLSCIFAGRKSNEHQDNGTTERVDGKCLSGFASSSPNEMLKSSSNRRASSEPKSTVGIERKEKPSAPNKAKSLHEPVEDIAMQPQSPPSLNPSSPKLLHENNKEINCAFPAAEQTSLPQSSSRDLVYSTDDDSSSEITGMSSQSTAFDILRDLEDCLNPILEEPEFSDEEGSQQYSSSDQLTPQYSFQLKDPYTEQPTHVRTDDSERIDPRDQMSSKQKTTNGEAVGQTKLKNTKQPDCDSLDLSQSPSVGSQTEARDSNELTSDQAMEIQSQEKHSEHWRDPPVTTRDNARGIKQVVSQLVIGNTSIPNDSVTMLSKNTLPESKSCDEIELESIDKMVKMCNERGSHHENKIETCTSEEVEEALKIREELSSRHRRTFGLQDQQETVLKADKDSIKQVICMLEEGTAPPGFSEIAFTASTRSRSALELELESLDKTVQMCINGQGSNHEEGEIEILDIRDPPSEATDEREELVTTRAETNSPSLISPSERSDADGGHSTPSEELFGLAVINESEEETSVEQSADVVHSMLLLPKQLSLGSDA